MKDGAKFKIGNRVMVTGTLFSNGEYEIVDIYRGNYYLNMTPRKYPRREYDASWPFSTLDDAIKNCVASVTK